MRLFHFFRSRRNIGRLKRPRVCSIIITTEGIEVFK